MRIRSPGNRLADIQRRNPIGASHLERAFETVALDACGDAAAFLDGNIALAQRQYIAVLILDRSRGQNSFEQRSRRGRVFRTAHAAVLTQPRRKSQCEAGTGWGYRVRNELKKEAR